MASGKCRILGPSCGSKGGSSQQLHRCDDCGAVGCWNCIAVGCKVCGSHKGHHSPVR